MDNSKLGHDAFVQIVERCSATGREILGHHILKEDLEEKSLLALDFVDSNLLFADLDENSTQQLVSMIEKMGLLRFNDNVRMLTTKRSVRNIERACYKPRYHYHYAEHFKTPLTAAYITEKVTGCRKMNEKMGQDKCLKRFVHHEFYVRSLYGNC